MAIYSVEELRALGFASIGEDVRVSRLASIYGASRIHLGDHVRIDDFCVLSAGAGGIKIGSYVHIAVYTCLIGAGHIGIADFANISSRVSIYSSSDDYSGEYMTNPMVSAEFTGVEHADVEIAEHVIIGSGSVVLPGVKLGLGVAVGALSLVNRSVEPWQIVAGQPAKFIKHRKNDLLMLADAFLQQSR
ncbi:galactoside O-acetyltransferase [Pseudoalteromonas ulvae UL12]|uniref:acyltransferase n=1 Tax=Pseudoalteromonas ulvae TaxID=107327 RepID=UPI00186BA8A1|nr:acyltransferase [Pseudoalteromonas ulvae]MBE0365085.1 galactoside O-acetyltransferase [Pseudoalteromonas ulvae UL12]